MMGPFYDLVSLFYSNVYLGILEGLNLFDMFQIVLIDPNVSISVVLATVLTCMVLVLVAALPVIMFIKIFNGIRGLI